MRIVERITSTAGRYVLTGTVCRNDFGGYVAHATTHLLTAGSHAPALSSPAVPHASGPDLEGTGATGPKARRRLCVAAKELLAATVTSFVSRPVVVMVASKSVAGIRIAWMPEYPGVSLALLRRQSPWLRIPGSSAAPVRP
jgi:hypothetical protein